MTTPAAYSAPLNLRLFGPMHALVNGRHLPEMRSRKGLWLLALLALRPEMPVARQWLAETLWPDSDLPQALANLRTVLSELRSGLGDQAERIQAPNRHTLRLDLAGAEVDVLRFDVRIKGGTVVNLEEAVALYGGPLLEGCSEEWVFQERNLREQCYLRALQQLGESAFEARKWAAAIDYYRRTVAVDPWLEAARRRWMEALAAHGDTNAALQVYREFVELLRNDSKAVPDEETTSLYLKLRSELSRKPARHAVVNTQPLPTVNGHLPHPLTNLIGRDDERIEVGHRLRQTRLLTLTGFGGVGKTRLARAVATDTAREYTDGVWLVSLETLSEGEFVVRQIASALGVKEIQDRPLLQSVTEHLRSKHLLLVMDNCEHLLEATAQVLAHILGECGKLRILATSREAIGMAGESVYNVPVLAMPDLGNLPQGPSSRLKVVSGYESVQLFVERAKAAHPAFELAQGNARSVAYVCRQLDGIPLAIELAAARVRAMTVEQIASRLDDHLDLLTHGSRTVQLRQQTLRATLDWSYNLLDESERMLLSKLSVFVDGWTLEASQHVCATSGTAQGQVLDLLASLVDKSLVIFDDQRHSEGRYRFLEVVRQYASERLEDSGKAGEVKSLHRDWCITLAETAEPHLRGNQQEEWLRRLEIEHDNWREALTYCGDDSRGAEPGLRLSGALGRFWYLKSDFKEGRLFLTLALERTQASARTAARAKALNAAGALAYDLSEYAEANDLFTESLSIQRDIGDRRAIALALNNLGNVAHDQCNYDRAKALYEESLHIQRDIGDKFGTALVLGNLGNVLRPWGDLASARALYQESLELYRELGDRRSIPLALERVGLVANLQGDFDAAWSLNQESLSLRREFGNRRGIAWSLCNLGETAHFQGRHDEARMLFEESLSILSEFEDRRGIATLQNNLGSVSLHTGQYTAASNLLEESVAMFRDLADRAGLSNSLMRLATVAYHQGEFEHSRKLHLESLDIHTSIQSRRGIAENLEGLGTLSFAETKLLEAAQLWGAADALRTTIGVPLWPIERLALEPRTAETRLALGEETFAAAWNLGTQRSWNEIAADCFTQAIP